MLGWKEIYAGVNLFILHIVRSQTRLENMNNDEELKIQKH